MPRIHLDLRARYSKYKTRNGKTWEFGSTRPFDSNFLEFSFSHGQTDLGSSVFNGGLPSDMGGGDDPTGKKQKNEHKNNESNSKLLFGIGVSAGVGVFAQALDVSAGILLNPKPGVYRGKLYFTVGTPIVNKNEVLPYFNASASGQFLFGFYNDKFELGGWGRAISGGSALSASYSNGYDKDFTRKSSSIWGIGPSLGLKYSGGGVKTYTWDLDFFLWLPSMRIGY